MALLTLSCTEENSRVACHETSSKTVHPHSGTGKIFRPWTGFVDAKHDRKNSETLGKCGNDGLNAREKVLYRNCFPEIHQDSTVSTTTPGNFSASAPQECSLKLDQKVPKEVKFAFGSDRQTTSSSAPRIADGKPEHRHSDTRFRKKNEKRKSEEVKYSYNKDDGSIKNYQSVINDKITFPGYDPAYDVSALPQPCCSEVPLVDSRTFASETLDVAIFAGMVPPVDPVLPQELISNFDLAIAQGFLPPVATIEEYARIFQEQQKSGSKKQRPKKYKCPHCQVAFSNNGQLKGHVRIHTGERPFKCDVESCGKTFTRNEELTRHKRIHSGIRPYPCSSCGKRFGRKDHLKKHSRTHQIQHRLVPFHMPLIPPFPYSYVY